MLSLVPDKCIVFILVFFPYLDGSSCRQKGHCDHLSGEPYTHNNFYKLTGPFLLSRCGLAVETFVDERPSSRFVMATAHLLLTGFMSGCVRLNTDCVGRPDKWRLLEVVVVNWRCHG